MTFWLNGCIFEEKTNNMFTNDDNEDGFVYYKEGLKKQPRVLNSFSKETLHIYEELLQKDKYKNLLKISQNDKPPFTNPTYCYVLTFVDSKYNNTDLSNFWKEYNNLKNNL